MWEWLKQKFSNIKNFFVNIWRNPIIPSPQEADKMVDNDINLINPLINIGNLLGDKPDPIHEIKKNAFTSIQDARKLLQRNDLKYNFNYDELCKLINVHRKELDMQFIQDSLKRNQISFLDLAQHSAKNALILLKSRFLNVFTAKELADIYYTHRHDKTFIYALIEKRESNTEYPNASRLPPISHILKKANREGTFESVRSIIKKSDTLLLIFRKELGYGQYKRQNHPHRSAEVQFPEKDPYVVLGLKRDANAEEIRKAYHRKALILHPDKVQTAHGNRFREVNEAYDFLKDPKKREAWDNSHPEDIVAEYQVPQKNWFLASSR